MNEHMKILIGYDGSECSDAALTDLRRAGLPPDAEAMVLSVADVPLVPASAEMQTAYGGVSGWPPASPASLAPETAEEAHRLAEAARQRLLDDFPSWDVSAESRIGLPDRAILRRAQEWKPDLVVVGSHGRSTLGRFVLGSVSLKVLARLHGTVRIARASRRAAGAAARLLVGFDGSAGAEEAVRVVASRRWPVGSEVRVIAVNDPRVLSTVYPLVPQVPLANPLQEGDGARWQRTADEAARELQAAGLAAAAFVRAGDPKHLLIDEAIRWGADCIFVGARGLGRFERFLIGSVSTSVAARAHCTVEVVRPLARTSDVWLSANECCLAQGQGGRAYA